MTTNHDNAYLETITESLFSAPGLSVIGARPKDGKTTVALDLVRASVFGHGKSALFLSLEERAAVIEQRLLAGHTNTDLDKMINGGLTENEQASLWQGMQEIGNGKIFVDHLREPSLEDITNRCFSHVASGKSLDVIFIDYLQLMSVSKGTSSNRNEAIEAIVFGLNKLSLELGVPVVIISQLNRNVTKREDKTPVLSDLSVSASLEQVARLIAFVYRSEGEECGRTLVTVAKNRSGAVGTSVRPKHGYSVAA